MKLSALKLKTIRTQTATWLVLVGFVVQLGVGTCGCMEHNGWVQLLQGEVYADGHSRDHDDLNQGTEVVSSDHGCSAKHHANDEINEQASADSPPTDAFRDVHECDPKAASEAVLAQSVRLPVLNLAVCWIDQCSTSAGTNPVCSASYVAAAHVVFSSGAARLVTQTFLI